MSFLSRIFKGRSTTMKEVAMELGMNYYESDEEELVHSLAGFKVFQRGRSRRVRNLLSHIEPQQGHELCIFDYSIVTGGGKNRSKRHFTIFMVRSSEMNLPLFQLKPKHFFHKVGEYIGWTKDIGFDTHPIFTQNYLLQGNQEIDIRHVFHTDLLDFFSREEGWYLEGFGSDMLFYRENGRAKKEAIPNLFDKGEYVYSLLR